MTNKLLFLTLLTSAIISCTKEGYTLLEDDLKTSDENTILKFTNEEEFSSTLSQVVELSIEELTSYEETKGYKSFGRECEEFYKNIDFDQFTSKDQIISFVEDNSEYLQLVDDENGELELETKFYKRADRYFINKDFMFQVGDILYKAIETGTIVANVNDVSVSEMKNVKSDNLKSIPSCRFIPLYNNETLKSTNGDYGTKQSWRSTNGKERLKVIIKITGGINKVGCHFLARPYKKTLGVWYHCSRTMKADVVIDYKYLIGPAPLYPDQPYAAPDKELTFYHNWAGSSKYEKTIEHWTTLDGKGYITGYDVWVDTYSVSAIDVEGN